jgi:hypothetical protein
MGSWDELIDTWQSGFVFNKNQTQFSTKTLAGITSGNATYKVINPSNIGAGNTVWYYMSYKARCYR